MEQWDGTVLDINATVKQLGEKFGGILPLHALSGHDTVSCGKARFLLSKYFKTMQ